LLDYVLANPWTQTIEQAQSFLDDAFSLPENSEMAQYYK